MRIEQALVVAVLFASFPAGAQTQIAEPTGSSAVGVRQRLPIATLAELVANHGQWAEDVLFLARRGGIEAVLLQDALVLHPLPRWTGPQSEEERRAGLPHEPEFVPGPPLTIRFPGARAVEGELPGPTAHHFLLGSGTVSHVPGYRRVVYRDVAPGIDVIVRAGEQWFAYDLHAQPGADLDGLVLEIEGAHDVELVDGRVLVMQTAAGRVEQRIDASWQVDAMDGRRTELASRFRLLGEVDGRVLVGFAAPGRDPTAAFVLDPSLVFATYVGGAGQEVLEDMDVAPDGSVYLAGSSIGGPTTPGAYQQGAAGVKDAWVAKLSPDGSTLEWATYVGGWETDNVRGVHIDQDGSVVVTGQTWSPDFPVTPGSLDTTNENAPSKSDLFVTRLAPDGSSLMWSTLYGGPDYELADTSALFPSGDVLIAGEPVNANHPPSTPGAFDTVYDDDDRMLVRISADGTQLVFQTYIAADIVDIAIDGGSQIYLAGSAGTEFPTTPGAYMEALAPGDIGAGAVAKMTPAGTELLWATYLGGTGHPEQAVGIAVDAAEAVYVAGHTGSDDFPVTTPALGGNNLNGFVLKLLASGTGVAWSTFLTGCCGSGGTTYLRGIATDPAGGVFASGLSLNTQSFPTTPDAYQPTSGGGISEAHLSKLDTFGETLLYSTYLGGSLGETDALVGLDDDHDPYLVIQTTSPNIPTTPGAYGPGYSGSTDMVVAKFSGIDMPPWRVRGGAIPNPVHTPNLAGAGALTRRSPTRLSVRGGLPSAAALLTIAYPSIDHGSTLGGMTFAPTAAVLLPVPTNADGALDLMFPWPGMPSGLRLVVQIWMMGTESSGSCATNELELITQ